MDLLKESHCQTEVDLCLVISTNCKRKFVRYSTSVEICCGVNSSIEASKAPNDAEDLVIHLDGRCLVTLSPIPSQGHAAIMLQAKETFHQGKNVCVVHVLNTVSIHEINQSFS